MVMFITALDVHPETVGW